MLWKKLISHQGGSAFSPVDLFDTEDGAVYDPSDLSTLWQDTAGTTAVTADGQSVARMDDLSGNGNHMLQATASMRPLYKTDGTYHWLLFDGTDDFMYVSGLGSYVITPSTSWFCSAGVETSDNTLSAQTILTSDPSGSLGNRAAQWLRFQSADASSIVFNTAQSAFNDTAGASISNNTPYVFSSDFDGANIEALVDQSGNGSTAMSGAQDLSTTILEMGAQSNSDETVPTTASFLEGRIYAAVLFLGSLTTQQQADTEVWIAGRSGVTL